MYYKTNQLRHVFIIIEGIVLYWIKSIDVVRVNETQFKSDELFWLMIKYGMNVLVM